MTEEAATVRVYIWADAGPYLGGIEEVTDGSEYVADGGFGDRNRVFEIPRELWERYKRLTEEQYAAESEIEELARKG